ncbi:hypothetical protein [Sphingomonas aurantiaca]|uniref:hypothetical protein n=1 Tax=Sphingomonas aurantiaca TaxID=185949 RepID=UPI00125F8A82|nr:hypothetical protein [Sphingomonas aurantiaca]
MRAAEKATDEARLSTIAAIAGTVLSLITVIGLIITIWQTRGALAEARRGNRLNLIFERRARREAKKAEVDQSKTLEIAERNAGAAMLAAVNMGRAVEVQERATIAANRAYIRFKPVGARFYTATKDDSSINMSLIMSWLNTGKVPARDIRIFTNSCFRPIGHIHPLPFHTDVPAEVFPSLAPGETVIGEPRTFDTSMINALYGGKDELYIWSRIEYDDGFSKERHFEEKSLLVRPLIDVRKAADLNINTSDMFRLTAYLPHTRSG